VRWGKTKCAAKRWLCAVGCSSFDFAEALASCCFFFLSLSFLFFRVRHNGFGLRAGGHFEAQNCQFTIKFISCKKLQITTIRPLAFSPCYQLGVLVCQWFEIIFQFSHSVFSVLKDLVFFVSAKSALADRQALWQVLVVRWFVRPAIVLGCVG
jgi:hypothetical protein